MTILSEKFAIYGSFDEKTIKNGQKVTQNWPSADEQKGYHVKTIEQLKVFFSLKDVSYNFTKSHQVSAASVDYSRSSRRKTGGGPLPGR